MPVTLLDRLPLPNLKVYTAGSVLLLSVAVYYAVNVTSNPNWKVNMTRESVGEGVSEGELELAAAAGGAVPPPALPDALHARNLTEQLVEVMTFMMHEPLCMWTLINISYCVLGVAGMAVQRAVFGRLRVAEAQRVKDKFWNYVFYKFIFVFGVINVQYMDEVLLWCCWFTMLGTLHLFGQLCKDRFEYLSSIAGGSRWAQARVGALVGGIVCAAAGLLVLAAAVGLPAGRDTFAFMAAECVLVLVSALHVVARYALQAYEADVAGPLTYYTHLIFDSVGLVVELVHVVHMVVYSNMLVSMASLVLLMQLRHVLHELQARLARHRLYTERATHITRNCPMASKEEVEKNQDNCAICWEPMKEARKLPCAHLFHNSCLCQWVQQDASCPTCRRPLRAPHARPHAPRHDTLFHFDGSRYVSWLPSFSVEVTRVRTPPADAPRRPAPPAELPLAPAELPPAPAALPPAPAAPPLAPAAPPAPPAMPPAPLDARRAPPDPATAFPVHIPATSPSTPNTPHASVSPATITQTVSEDKEEAVRFGESVSEREASLQHRKMQLVAAARARYLAKQQLQAVVTPAARAAPDAPAEHS